MENVKKIKVLSFAKFQAILFSLIGFVCGVVYSFGGLLIDFLVTIEMLSPVEMSTTGIGFGTVLAFGALIGMPIIFTSFGFVLGVLEALFFNFFAKYIDGVKIDFKQ